MLWDRYLAMSFRLSKAQPAGQMLSPPMSAPRGPLQSRGKVRRRLTDSVGRPGKRRCWRRKTGLVVRAGRRSDGSVERRLIHDNECGNSHRGGAGAPAVDPGLGSRQVWKDHLGALVDGGYARQGDKSGGGGCRHRWDRLVPVRRRRAATVPQRWGKVVVGGGPRG